MLKKLIYLSTTILALALILAIPAKAANTGTVTATVTAQNISVSVSDGSIAYGTLATNATKDTTTNGLNDSQTGTNDGNIAADINIKGQDSANWTLGETAGVNTYTHKFCTSDCDANPSWTALTTNYQTLKSSLSASGTQVFDLQIGTPTSTSNFGQQSVDVTVQATAS